MILLVTPLPVNPNTKGIPVLLIKYQTAAFAVGENYWVKENGL